MGVTGSYFEKHLDLCNNFEVLFSLVLIFHDMLSSSYFILDYALLLLIGIMFGLICSLFCQLLFLTMLSNAKLLFVTPSVEL